MVQNTSGLQIYFPRAEQSSTIPSQGAFRVERVNSRTLRGFYRDLPGNYTAEDAVGAFVDQGTVQAAQGSRGGNDGVNAFDEVLLSSDPQQGRTCDGVAATITGRGQINGTNGDDVIIGSDRDDTINGGGGDDLICGAGGGDTINGDGGDDNLFGDRGRDKLAGGPGNDRADGGRGRRDTCDAEREISCER